MTHVEVVVLLEVAGEEVVPVPCICSEVKVLDGGEDHIVLLVSSLERVVPILSGRVSDS